MLIQKVYMSRVQEELIKKINSDPVLWAKSHIITYDNAAKKYVPWTARWYQAEMLRDKSRKKVYRRWMCCFYKIF